MTAPSNRPFWFLVKSTPGGAGPKAPVAVEPGMVVSKCDKRGVTKQRRYDPQLARASAYDQTKASCSRYQRAQSKSHLVGVENLYTLLHWWGYVLLGIGESYVE